MSKGPGTSTTPERLAAWIEAIASRDEKALASLYDATSSWVYGLALRILGDTQAAEEIAHDTYLHVWRNASSYEPARGTPGAWLLAMTRSRAIDRLRSRLSRGKREQALSEGFDAPAERPGPDAASAALEQQALVKSAVRTLPREQRAAIELAFFEGLTHAEVAQRLAEPLGTIKTRIRLGMTKLRTILGTVETLA